MITLKDITLRRASKLLLDQASLTIHAGDKMGLVGRNGAGKSSLLALLQGQLTEDSGQYHRPAHWRFSQVAQELPETSDNATDFVIAADGPLMAARALVKEATETGDGERMALAYAQLSDAGEHDAVPRAQSLLMGLGFQSHELTWPVNQFSGGWQMRLQLARALMAPAELLLLDEPTNHLDLDALVWLEQWLKRFEGAMIVISHDRDFLDAVTHITLHIDQGQLQRYNGHYSQFERQRAERIQQQQLAYAKQQERMAHLQSFIARFKAKASKAKQAQSRVKALARMETIVPLLDDAAFAFEFHPPTRLPNPMLSLQSVSVGYASSQPNGSAHVILQKIHQSVLAGQRIGILGANGQGKSTLVKTITRNLPALAGHIVEGKGLNIGYFAQQELDVLEPQENPLAHMVALVKRLQSQGLLSGQALRESDLRAFLGQFDFSGDMALQAVGSMSGGEKARLVLAMLVWQRPHLLLLDEPTNHLDLTTREALSLALNSFEGSVILVSHDRALLRSVCDEFWLVANGGLTPFDGDLDDYQQYVLDQAKKRRQNASDLVFKEGQNHPATPPNAAASTDKPSPSKPSKGMRKQWEKNLEKIEASIQTLEQQRDELQSRMAMGLSIDTLAQDSKALKQVETELETLESQWLALAAQLESAAP